MMAAAPPNSTAAAACRLHPFHSRDRINFPEFSPIFSRHATPENTQGFHWSIDHIARLKPADIDTDPTNLLKTNGRSPENEEERRQLADTFFSQGSILPSPWPVAGHNRSSLRWGLTPSLLLPRSCLTPVTSSGGGHPKKVTFSPHPPSLAYISSDSIESDNKENVAFNVGTQTAVTIPLSYNLEELLGPACVYSEVDGAVSCVRDLANTSLRRKLFGQPSREEDDEEEEEEEEELPPATDNVTPIRCSSGNCSHLSSTPLKSRPSHCPHHLLTSSPPLFSADRHPSCPAPITSSLVVTPGGTLPQFSPIEGAGGSAEKPKENCDSCKRLFSLTPNPQQPVSGPHHTPSPSCPLFSPILSHHRSVGGACEGVLGARGGGALRAEPVVTVTPLRDNNSPNQATSTPYLHGFDMRHQQLAGPETSSHEEGERGGGVTVGDEGGSEDSEGIPQPISLADLQTCEDDLTSVTGVTTCTSYFTQLATDDSRNDRQPLHSTVAVLNPNPSIPTVDPHRGAAAHLRLPSIREISRINEPSIVGAGTTDSGVVGSMDINPPPSSRGTGISTDLDSPAENMAVKSRQQQLAIRSEVDSGLVPSPDHAHTDHTHIDEVAPTKREEMGAVGFNFNPQPTTTPGEPTAACTHHKTQGPTPSRYSTTHLHRNKLGVPLLVSQKFPANRLLHGNFLPSHPRLLPSRQTPPPMTSSREVTPSRLPDWFGGLLGQDVGHTPIFPEEVVRRKATLKAQLQFCSPVRSRSPLSRHRRPLFDTLNLPSPVTAHHFSPSTLHPSPLPYRTLLTQLTQD